MPHSYSFHNIMPVIPVLQMGGRTLSSAQKYVQVPFVLACLDGLLGSPVPMVLLAKTRNSYSTQGLSSVTVALSWWPATTSGTDMKHNATFSAQKGEEREHHSSSHGRQDSRQAGQI